MPNPIGAPCLTALLELMDRHLPPVEFAIIFGSVARGERSQGSDMDLLVALPDESLPTGKRAFREGFAELQRHFDYRPDLEFPAEIVTLGQLRDAIRWRGVQREPSIQLPPIGPNDWDNENQHRQWLCATAGPNALIHGNTQQFELMRRTSLASVSLLSLAAAGHEQFTCKSLTRSLLVGGKQRLGFCATPGTRQYLRDQIPIAVKLLIELGVARPLEEGAFEWNIQNTQTVHQKLAAMTSQ